MSIDITGIDKATLLAALYNRQPPLVGVIAFEDDLRMPMTDKVAAIALIHDEKPAGEWRFDYLHGRPIKVSFVGDVLENEHMFDRNAGEGACVEVVKSLRERK